MNAFSLLCQSALLSYKTQFSPFGSQKNILKYNLLLLINCVNKTTTTANNDDGYNYK